MKREGLLRHLRRHGCVLRREGKEHTLWENPQTGHADAVPRHAEIGTYWQRGFVASCRSLIRPGRGTRSASRVIRPSGCLRFPEPRLRGECRRPSSSPSRHSVQAVINGVRAYLSPVIAASRPHQSAADEGKKIIARPAADIL
jgi:hypothetical protein